MEVGSTVVERGEARLHTKHLLEALTIIQRILV